MPSFSFPTPRPKIFSQSVVVVVVVVVVVGWNCLLIIQRIMQGIDLVNEYVATLPFQFFWTNAKIRSLGRCLLLAAVWNLNGSQLFREWQMQHYIGESKEVCVCVCVTVIFQSIVFQPTWPWFHFKVTNILLTNDGPEKNSSSVTTSCSTQTAWDKRDIFVCVHFKCKIVLICENDTDAFRNSTNQLKNWNNQLVC